MTEKKKRFTKCDDGTFCLLDNGKGLEYDEVIDLFNELYEENEQLKQDKKRLIGYLHRYGKVDVEDIDDIILKKEYFDEWGDLYE